MIFVINGGNFFKMIAPQLTHTFRPSNSRCDAFKVTSSVAESPLKVATGISLTLYPVVPAVLKLIEPLLLTCKATCVRICMKATQINGPHDVNGQATSSENDGADNDTMVAEDNNGTKKDSDHSTRFEIIFLMMIMGGLKYLTWSGFAEIIKKREADKINFPDCTKGGSDQFIPVACILMNVLYEMVTLNRWAMEKIGADPQRIINAIVDDVKIENKFNECIGPGVNWDLNNWQFCAFVAAFFAMKSGQHQTSPNSKIVLGSYSSGLALAIGMAFFCGNQPISAMDQVDNPDQKNVMWLHGFLFTWFFCLAAHNIACDALNRKGMFLMEPLKVGVKYLMRNFSQSSDTSISSDRIIEATVVT